MKFSRVLTALVLGSLELCSASSTSSSVKLPKKIFSTSVSSLPVKLDSTVLKNLNDFSRSPLKVTDQETNRLALDFDDLSKDKSFPSNIFSPKEASIYSPDSWEVPLNEIEDMKNLLNLEEKLADIRSFLKEELVDSASSFSWVSNGNLLVNYILVVSTSISQLSYLISRLSFTDCSPEISKRVYALVSEHLRTLSDFSKDIIEYSGRVGITIEEGKLQGPEDYFKALFALRDEEDLKMGDEMFRIFIEFFFQAFAADHSEVLTNCYLDYIDSDRWAPLPITYFHERWLLEYPENLASFVSQWKAKVFESEKFDSRNLVNLGYLLQIGIINKNTLLSVIDSARRNSHRIQYEFNKEMIKFLTLLASTPWILPSDQDTALLIGNFSFSLIGSEYSPSNHEGDKKAIYTFFWDFFVGSADFSKIEREEYKNLCKLIQRLDFTFPGIADGLWLRIKTTPEVEGRGTFRYAKANDVYEMFKSKIESFEEIENLNGKIEFLKLNFSDESTIENDLIDTKILFLLFDFFTKIFADSVEYVVEGENTKFAAEHQEILNFCIKFFDSFLIKFAHKSVINYWYEKLEFLPTKFLNSLNDLWMISQESDFTNLTPNNCLIWENVAKIFDFNEKFARIFMFSLKGKTGKFGKPAFSAKFSTPKCLIQNGDSNALNFEYFREILSISNGNENEIFDEFFIGLSVKLANEEIFFDSIENLFKEILENNFSFKISGYSKFWSPSLMIQLTKMKNDRLTIESLKESFKLYLKMNKRMEVNHDLLTNISVLMSFSQNIRGELKTDASAGGVDIDSIRIRTNFASEQFQNVSYTLLGAFNRIIVDGVCLNDAHRIFLKLLEIARIGASFNVVYSQTALVGLIFAFNALLLSIIRIPEFVIPDEEKSVLILHELYSKYKDFFPFYNENLLRVLRQRSSVVALYDKLIKNFDALPPSAFDFPIINDKRTILKIQQDYIKMLGSDPENMSIIRLNSITSWIKNGKMDPATFLKLLQTIKPDQHRIIANCIPLISEFVNNKQLPVKIRVEALEIAFSEANNELVKRMANRRLFIFYENFMNLLLTCPNEVLDSFLDNCTEEDWYVGVKIGIERILSQKMFESNRTTASFNLRDEGYLTDLLDILNAPQTNYEHRRAVVRETDQFVAKMSHMLPILRDGITNRPLQNCFYHLISINLQISDGLAFLLQYPNTETVLGLLNVYVTLFRKSHRGNSLLFWILDSIKELETKLSAARMLQKLVTTDSFVLSGSGALKVLENWFSDVSELENYMSVLVQTAFSSISADLTVESAPVLDEMFATLSEAFELKIEAVCSCFMVHHQVLLGLTQLKSQRRDLIEDSKYLMKYLKNLVETHAGNNLFYKVLEILKDFPSLYLTNKIDWIITWKKLSQNLSNEFMRNPSFKVYAEFGNENIHEWEPILHLIPSMNLPSNLLARLFIEVSKRGSEEYLDILQLLPEKLEINHVKSFKEVEIFLNYISNCLDIFKDSSDDNLSVSEYDKLFVLLDFNVKIGRSRDWKWSGILNISNMIRELEYVVLYCLTEKFPDLLEQSCSTVEEILSVLFEFSSFGDKKTSQHNDAIIKSVLLYNKLSGTTSSDSLDVSEYLKTKLDILIFDYDSLTETLVSYMGLLNEFKVTLVEAVCRERNDRFAIDSFTFIMELANKIFLKDTKALNKEMLSEFSDLIVELIYEILKAGNIVGFAQAADVASLETLIASISYDVRNKIDEFKFIISEAMKFAPIDVSDLFYQQINGSEFRVDVCFFTKSIIKQFSIVTQSHQDYDFPDASWPGLYLTTLIEADLNIPIDADHFKNFEYLLSEVVDEMVPEQILLSIVGLTRTRPDDLSNILDFIDNLHKNFTEKFTLKDIYENFLLTPLVKSILSKSSHSRFIRFLKEMKKKSIEEFNRWETNLQPETKKLLTKTLQTDADTMKTTLHTGVASKMIERIVGIDFDQVEQVENLLKGFRNLDAKFVEDSVTISLENIFIQRLRGVVVDDRTLKVVQDCCKFLLNFRVFEPETFDNLIEIILQIFSQDFLTILEERADNREGFRAILMKLRTRIDFDMWKNMKQKLLRFKLWEDEEILLAISKNSEPWQFLEIFSGLKNLSCAKKLEILENCLVTSGVERVNKLIIFYKSIIATAGNKMIGLQSMMRNESISECFRTTQKSFFKNKAAILSILKNNLHRREIIGLSNSVDSIVMKIVVNLYFKPSSTKDPLIPHGPSLNICLLKDLFDSYLFEIQNSTTIKNKTPMYMRAFRFYNEIEDNINRNKPLNATATFTEGFEVLGSMIEGLDASLKSSNIFVSSPEIIYAFYKLARRVPSKKRERNAIIRKLLISSRYLTRDGVNAFLRAQAESGNIDWVLHDELKHNARSNPTIMRILNEFDRIRL